jgi:hypothetical protein
MANIDGAFGLKPVRRLGGVANFTANEYVIASGATGPIYQGSPVIMDAAGGGDIIVAAAGATDIVGVFGGCSYTDPTSGKPVFSNYYPGSIAASDIVAQIYDDPKQVFEIQCDGTIAQASVGANADMTSIDSGSSTTGKSSAEISATTASGTAQLRIIGMSKDPDNDDQTAANGNVYVYINEHAYTQTTGTK